MRLIRAVLLISGLMSGARADAQSVPLTPEHPRVWDASLNLGWLAGRGKPRDESSDWYDSVAGSLQVGRHWRPHLKADAGITLTGEGTFYSHELLVVSRQGPPVFRFAEHHVRVTHAHAAATCQFLNNAWVHPFLTGGVLVGWERERRDIQEPRSLLPPAFRTEHHRSVTVHPVIGGGVKFYLNERAFIRTDTQVTLDADGPAHVISRGGVGFDF